MQIRSLSKNAETGNERILVSRLLPQRPIDTKVLTELHNQCSTFLVTDKVLCQGHASGTIVHNLAGFHGIYNSTSVFRREATISLKPIIVAFELKSLPSPLFSRIIALSPSPSVALVRTELLPCLSVPTPCQPKDNKQVAESTACSSCNSLSADSAASLRAKPVIPNSQVLNHNTRCAVFALCIAFS